MIPPDDFDPPIGVAIELSPGLRRIVAPNPSPMTYRGTNTYLLGTSEIAVIDPGPASDDHLQAILAAISPPQKVTHIIVTHTHLDHSPLAKPLSAATGAPVYAFGGADAGRSEIMQTLASAGDIGGGEGIDIDFTPDIEVGEGALIESKDWQLRALHTPGHIGNHLCLEWGEVCFTADHVMGWASSLVSPPDGDLTDFMASCAKLARKNWRIFHPGHGAPIEAPQNRLAWLMNHRQSRETEILQALGSGPSNARGLAERIYTETPPALLGAATRNVLAHLIDLHGKNHVTFAGRLSAETIFFGR